MSDGVARIIFISFGKGRPLRAKVESRMPFGLRRNPLIYCNYLINN
jgi:hypothetical protein